MLNSLRTRLWLTYVMLTLGVLGTVGLWLVMYLLRNPTLDRQTYLRLNTVATIVNRRMHIISSLTGRDGLQRAAQSFEMRFLLLSPEGQVREDVYAGDAPVLRITPSLLQKKEGLVRAVDGTAWLFVSRPLSSGGWLWVAARRPSRLSALRTLLGDELLSLFGRAALLSLGLSFLLAYGIARWVLAPLQHMAQAASALAQGETRLVPLEGPREVQTLGRAFNEMSREVQASRQSQRDFVANVSHDLKTPLTSIRGFAQALLDGTAEDPAVRRYAAQVIYDEAGRMHRLVLDLLELARFDAGTVHLQIAPTDMGALLQHLVHNMTPQAQEKKVRLELIHRQETPRIQADADRLLRVFTNLLDNAIRHTPAGGCVTLRLEPAPQGLRVSVEDTGPGIPANALPRLFERFYRADASRADREQHGAGLGLAIANEIVRAHAGTLQAANRPEGGARFVVFLPIKPPEH